MVSDHYTIGHSNLDVAPRQAECGKVMIALKSKASPASVDNIVYSFIHSTHDTTFRTTHTTVSYSVSGNSVGNSVGNYLETYTDDLSTQLPAPRLKSTDHDQTQYFDVYFGGR